MASGVEVSFHQGKKKGLRVRSSVLVGMKIVQSAALTRDTSGKTSIEGGSRKVHLLMRERKKSFKTHVAVEYQHMPYTEPESLGEDKTESVSWSTSRWTERGAVGNFTRSAAQ